MNNLKKVFIGLMIVCLFLISCNKSSNNPYVVDQGEIKSTQEDMDKGTIAIQTSGIMYTMDPEVWGKPFQNLHVYTEVLEKRDHSGDIYGGMKCSFVNKEQIDAYGKVIMNQSLDDTKKKSELDKIINSFSKIWAINVISDDKMPKDDEALKSLTGFDNNEKLASVDGFNFVWSTMNKAEGLKGEDQEEYDKFYADLENVKKSIKVSKPLNINPSEGAQAAKFNFDSEDIFGNKFVSKDYLAEHEYTIVNVWGTFCGPCKAEMPDLAKAYEEYKDKVGFLGVVADIDPLTDGMSDALKQNREDLVTLAKRIVNDKGVKYANIVPTQEMNDNFLAAVTGYPTTFVLDKEGNIVDAPAVGAQSYEQFKQLCEQYSPKSLNESN